MQVDALLILLLIGAVAGFLAGVIVKGYGFGVLGNIVVGIVGAVVAGALLPRLGLFPGGDIIGQIISATIGAVVLLVLIGFIRRIA
ncbi:MAG: GlsB/YeaQ/YmgE family stress response membrane protein [Hyphomicrobiaceae bacterium]